MTTVCVRSSLRMAAPISSATRWTYSIFRAPVSSDGVPTHTRESSVLRTASSADVVPCIVPACAYLAMSSGRSFSTIGLLPFFRNSTLDGSTSIPQTSWPRSQKHAAETHPTYPSPNTLIFIVGFPEGWKGASASVFRYRSHPTCVVTPQHDRHNLRSFTSIFKVSSRCTASSGKQRQIVSHGGK